MRNYATVSVNTQQALTLALLCHCFVGDFWGLSRHYELSVAFTRVYFFLKIRDSQALRGHFPCRFHAMEQMDLSAIDMATCKGYFVLGGKSSLINNVRARGLCRTLARLFFFRQVHHIFLAIHAWTVLDTQQRNLFN